MPSPLRQRIYCTLRATTLALLSILFVLFALVQFQQHLLRHRAEKLAADIAYLRDHPGNWSDLQRMQQRWGAFAHYDGTCNPQHCDYHIYISDFLDRQRIETVPLWLLKAYIRLGGRPSWVDAELRLTQNHLWGYHFNLATGITSMVTGLDDGFVLGIDTAFGPRLFSPPHRSEISAAVYRDRYRIDQPSRCMFCIEKWLAITPSTPKANRDRLAVINFSCITRFHPCTGIADIAPGVEAQDRAETTSPQQLKDPRDAYRDPRCEVPLSTRATEADNIMAIDILSSDVSKDVEGKIDSYMTNARVIEPLKNAFNFHMGATARFYGDTSRLNPLPTAASLDKLLPLTTDSHYIVLFQHPFPINGTSFDLEECSAVLDTPQARAEIAKGIANDPSTGEDYFIYPPQNFQVGK